MDNKTEISGVLLGQESKKKKQTNRYQTDREVEKTPGQKRKAETMVV